jgi:hypothetical protein
MWQCPKCRSEVDDSFKLCWLCGTTPDGIEDPNFVTADESEPIDDQVVDKKSVFNDSLQDFAGTLVPDLVECYAASNTTEAAFIANQLMEQAFRQAQIAEMETSQLVCGSQSMVPKSVSVSMTFHEPKPGSKPTSNIVGQGRMNCIECSSRNHFHRRSGTTEGAPMSKVLTTTFLVSDVSPATMPLEEVPYKEAVEALFKTAAPTGLPRPSMHRPVEACARYHGHLIDGVPFHPVAAAAHRAFMDHRPLCLSPDAIWLMICQGVANHINAHAEQLRSRFVRHQGKIQIGVRRDDFVKGSPENPWADAIEEFSKKVREHIGSAYDLFEPAFTTTGPVERVAAGVVLLDAMQSHFTYDMDTLCGIPAITLEGTPEDWQAVADRADQFGSLDLEWWLEPLRGVLHQFVAAARGHVDRPFWQSLYKYHDESGGPMITGWFSTLLPYLKDGRTGKATNRNPWLTLNSQQSRFDDLDDEIDDEIDDIDIDEGDHYSESMKFESYRPEDYGQQGRAGRPDAAPDLESDFGEDLNDELDYDDFDHKVGAWLRPMPKPGQHGYPPEDDPAFYGEGPRLADLPFGLSKAPFRWDYLDQSFNMEFLGGFVGVAQDQETLTLRPEIGWAVRESPNQA